MNNATFAGRLGRDAELRYTADGTPVASLALAVDEYAGPGERKTLWVDCSLWGKRAEALAPYLAKGSPLAVSGGVGLRTYEGKSGFGASMTLRITEITLLGRTDGATREHVAAPASPQPAQQERQGLDDNIPF